MTNKIASKCFLVTLQRNQQNGNVSNGDMKLSLVRIRYNTACNGDYIMV